MLRHGSLKISAAVALVAAAALSSAAQAQDRHRVCHHTGSGFQLLEVNDAGLVAHLAHQEDIYPAPADGCPVDGAPPPTVTATPTPPTPPPSQATPSPTPEVVGTITPPEDDEIPPPTGTGTPTPEPQVDGDATTGSLPGPAAGPRHALPATGSDPRLILLAGLGLVFAGLGGRVCLGARRGA